MVNFGEKWLALQDPLRLLTTGSYLVVQFNAIKK
jgi:hypothetical protein